VVLNPLTGLTGGSGLTFAATGPVTIDEFMALSEALTDDALDLRPSVGARYLAALDAAAIRTLVDATKGKTTFAAILASGGLKRAERADGAADLDLLVLRFGEQQDSRLPGSGGLAGTGR